MIIYENDNGKKIVNVSFPFYLIKETTISKKKKKWRANVTAKAALHL